MKSKNVIAIVLILVSVVFAAISLFLLPENVIIQFSLGNSGTTTMPKMIAVLLAAALGIGGAVAFLIPPKNEKSVGKSLLVSGVGIMLFVLMLIFNSFTN